MKKMGAGVFLTGLILWADYFFSVFRWMCEECCLCAAAVDLSETKERNGLISLGTCLKRSVLL
jgi:hypothetical protein